MPSIDERVVSMAFENTVFEQRVTQTISTLTRLDTAIKNIGNASGLENIEKAANKVTLQGPMSALDKLRAKLSGAGSGAAEGLSEIDRAGNRVTLEGPARAVDKLQGKMAQLSAGSTFTDIDKAADRVTLSGLTNALDNVTAKFSILQGAASVALGNIGAQAAMKGGNFAKSFAFGPLQQGLGEYQTNLQSIQTILANTQGQQVSGLDATQSALGELNTYSDKTIYNFGEMAKNIGTFTAAGVDLPKSVQSIKGIANLAALSGSNSQQAATAMYQLSQAIASGRVGLQDWNSVVNAGMGGAVFQKSLMRTAESMGALEKGAVKIDKATGKATVNGQSFRESIMAKPGEQSWLTSDVLTKTLGQFTGDLSAADLAAQGFSESQIKAIQTQAKSAQEAATQVKTLPQVFDVARETIGSGWSKTFSLLFGDFEESKKTFTEFSNFINGFINQVSNARNKVLGEWSKLGGRTVLIEGIKNAFHDLLAIITPIKDAFRDIFPAKTGRDLFEMTKNFTELMAQLKPSQQTIDNLRRIFGGLFAVVHIGWTIIKDFVGVIFDLLGVAGKGSGGFLEFVAGIGDFLKSVDAALTQGGLLKGLFTGLEAVIKAPLGLLVKLAQAISGLFSGGDNQSLVERNNELERFGKALTPAERLVNRVKDAWNKLVDAFNNAKSALEPWFSSFVGKLQGLGQLIGDALSNIKFDDVLKGIQTGLLAGLLVTLRQAFGKGGGFLDSLKGTLDSVNGLLGGFTKQLEAMQSKLKAEALLAIAGAVAVLAAGIYILSTIDGDKLAKAMAAVAVGLGELMGAMKLMTSGMGLLGALQLPLIAAGLIGLATAVLILSGAMKIFATMSWEDMAKGLAGVAGSIAAVGVSMKLMPPTLPLTAAGLILIGVALNLIAGAMKVFGSMKLEEIGKGLFAMVEALAGIALGVSMMPPTLPLTAAGLVILGVALGVISSAIKRMGELDFLTIIKGLGTMMAAIAGIGLAMSLMPPNVALTAAGLFIVANAMVILGQAMKVLGGMSVEAIVKSLVAMGGALLIIGAGLIFMSGTLAGSAALLVAATALAILAPTLAFLGTLKWSTIIKGLGAIALTLGTLAVVGALAAQPLAMLGLALLPLAGVFVLTAGAVFLFAKALALLGSSGGKGVAVMITALTAFVALIPTLVLQFIKGLLGIVDELAKLAPKVVVALGVIIDTIIAFVIANAAKLAMAVGILIDAILSVFVTNTPKIIAAGIKILGDLLSGISQNIEQITTKVAEIITKFLNALAAKAPQLTAAGANLLNKFLQGITTQIPKVVTTVADMVVKFINALSQNINRIVTAGQNLMIKFIAAIALFVPRLVQEGLKMIGSFISGISRNINQVVSKGADLIIKFIQGITSNMNKIANQGADAVIKFLNSLAATIRNKGPQLRAAGWNVASALIDGIWAGIAELGHKVADKLGALVNLLPQKVKKILGIASPSSVFMDIGRQTVAGLAKGLGDSSMHGKVTSAGSTMANLLPTMVRKVLGIHSPSEVMKTIGEQVNQGFAQGLRGSISDVRGAFNDLNSKLKEQIATSKQTIADEQGKINEQLRSDTPDAAAIAESQKVIKDNLAILRATSAARFQLNTNLKAEEQSLVRLNKQYESVNKKLEAAQTALDNLKSQRDDFQKSTQEKFGGTPAIDQQSATPVQDYTKALRDQITATASYTVTLQKLRAAGLDDTTYRKLLDEGLAGKAFAESLLAGGPAAIKNINDLDKQILSVSTTLAQNATTNLYSAGVKAAEGLVRGLKSRSKALKGTMNDLADDIVREIKKKLKIKSPSEEFQTIGYMSAKGFAVGYQDGSKEITNAVVDSGGHAISTAKALFGRIRDDFLPIKDTNPVITPVVDMTHVDKAKQGIDDLSKLSPLTAAQSFAQAEKISQTKASLERDTGTPTGPTTTITYEQNNYSPDPISNIELYRQTNNQLSRLKSLVGVT
jgi:tape measure domain-containing protein